MSIQEDLLKLLLEAGSAGLGIFALWIFYKLFSAITEAHRKEREKESEAWRTTVTSSSERVDRALSEVVDAIRETNRR